MYFEARHVDTLEFISKTYRDDIKVDGGVLRSECAELYYGPDDDLPMEEQANLFHGADGCFNIARSSGDRRLP